MQRGQLRWRPNAVGAECSGGLRWGPNAVGDCGGRGRFCSNGLSWFHQSSSSISFFSLSSLKDDFIIFDITYRHILVNYLSIMILF
jgi:hypothetical protein